MGRIAAQNCKLRRIVEFLDVLTVRFKSVLPNLGLHKPRSKNEVLTNPNKKPIKTIACLHLRPCLPKHDSAASTILHCFI